MAQITEDPYEVLGVHREATHIEIKAAYRKACLLYTSDAADERSSVDLGGRRIIKKKNQTKITYQTINTTHIVHTKHRRDNIMHKKHLNT